MKTKWTMLTLLLIVSIIAFPLPGLSQDNVVIGIPLPLTGQFKEFGFMMKQSFEMARENINKQGGINGKPLNIIFADDKGKEDAAEKAFHDLTTAGPAMLVGGYASNPTYRLAKMADKKNIPFLICTASADRITQKGWKNIFRMNPPISEYTQGLEDFWRKNIHPKSMAIIYENSMFGSDGATRMMAFCRENAIEIRAHMSYDQTMTDPAYFRAIIAPLTDEPPDVIYMISYLEDAVTLVKEIRGLKIPSLLCGGGGGFTLDEFVRKAGNSANGLLTVALWSAHVQYPGAKDFYRGFFEQFGRYPDYHGAEAYAALLVAADALNRSASFDPEDIRKALNDTYIKTPFGPVKFYTYEGFERQNSVNTLVLQVINGTFETIWPPNLASAQYIISNSGNE